MNTHYIDPADMEHKGYYANKLLYRIHAMNEKLHQPIDIELVKKAITQLQAHYQITEKGTTGKAYTKPIVVALLLTEYCLTTETLIAALLYNLVIEDNLKLDTIAQEFGDTVANKLSTLVTLKIDHQNKKSTNQIKHIIEKGDKDILLIKLLDNVYEMQNIATKSKWEQLEAALESLKTFLPLAVYLNLPEVESKLTEICHSIILPDELNELRQEKPKVADKGLALGWLEFQT